MSPLLLPGTTIPLAYDGGPPAVACAEADYATDALAMPLLPFPSWVNPADARYSMVFVAETGPGLTDLPVGMGPDPDPTHVSPFTMEFWTDLPDAAGAVQLYSGGPGTSSGVPLDFAITWLSASTSAGSSQFVNVLVEITRKDITDPATYYATDWHVCVPIVPITPTVTPPGGGPPPSTVPLGAPALSEIQFRQSVIRQTDAYSHAALGAPVTVTWARRYMDARRLWERGHDLYFGASVGPVAKIAYMDLILASLPDTTATGGVRYLTIGHEFNRAIAPG